MPPWDHLFGLPLLIAPNFSDRGSRQAALRVDYSVCRAAGQAAEVAASRGLSSFYGRWCESATDLVALCRAGDRPSAAGDPRVDRSSVVRRVRPRGDSDGRMVATLVAAGLESRLRRYSAQPADGMDDQAETRENVELQAFRSCWHK